MSATANDIPDSIRSYLNEIAERLWAGRAAVMVGAGFSKNADREFPDWNQLGDLFYQKAHGAKPDPGKQRYLNPLRLAEEVQASIGRPALENLLYSNIPDLDIKPSDLHKNLLELPWVDVFTTNFDTLLERASDEVVTRRYEPVLKKEDIPYANKPRIVKLHGSFPSERPFIITEEDYRRYPHKYAPFVNTVQQSLLENTFCLIGFSGDDPNFLQWIGWIRDNLGKDKMQKIYLVGVFNLSSARLQLLSERGIIVVELSCCNNIEKHDHKNALGLFFKYMQSKKPDALDWPYNPKGKYLMPNQNHINEIQKVTEEWRLQRNTYPGWLILPYTNRKNLWVYTNGWVNYLPDKSPPGIDIGYTFELVWRLEKCLLPISSDIEEYCEKILEKYWPFKSENLPKNCQIHPSDNKFIDLPWSNLKQAWLFIAITLLRFYREEGFPKKWKKKEAQLKALSAYLSAQQVEFLKYECFLFSLFTLDLSNAKKQLENWHPNETQPYWMAKRAAGLAEIGTLSRLDDKIQLSLVESRKKNKNYATSPDYQTISHEAYQMLLLRYVKNATSLLEEQATPEEEQLIKDKLLRNWETKKQRVESGYHTNNTIKSKEEFSSFKENWGDLNSNRVENRKQEWEQLLREVRNEQRKRELQQQNARWDELKALRCDPWNELKLFELDLKNQPSQRMAITKKREFDIGRVSITYHSSSFSQEKLSAYSFLRFCEVVGLPFRIGSSTMAKETALASLQHISQDSSFWAIATLARIGDAKTVDSLFNRESIYKLTTNEADQLICDYLDALNKCKDDIHEGNAVLSNNYGVRLAQLLPEIVSRLCCKCSAKSKHRIFEFITSIYASPHKKNYRNVRNLTNRLIKSMSEEEQYMLAPNLLKIPFPENLNHLVEKEFPNPFLLLEIYKKPECAPALKIQPELIEFLLEQASLEDSYRRRWAITSLVKLYNLQLLDNVQNKTLAEAIWRRVDQQGLPDNTDFYKFSFLSLPHPEGINPVHLFKKYVESTSFPIQGEEQGISLTQGNIPIVDEIIGANRNDPSIWTKKDATEILKRLLEWWGSDKDKLREEEDKFTDFPSTSKEFRARFTRMLELLTEVVGPKLNSNLPGKIKNSLKLLFKEVREYKLPSLAAEVACLHIFPNQKSDVYERINEALTSSQESIQIDGLKGVEKIIHNENHDVKNSIEYEPTLMLSQYLTWCSTKSLNQALRVIIGILRHSPTKFCNSLELATHRRLDRLFTDTAYADDNPDLNFDENLEIQSISSILAATLWKYYRSQNSPIPEVVEKWRKRSLSSDEFSEIRNPWINC